MIGIHVHNVTSLVLMAIAIGMDVFSVSLGLGMQQLRLRRIAFIGLIFGIFHIIFPLIGIMLGTFISHQVGHFATLAAGFLLFFIGSQMIFAAFNYDAAKVFKPFGIGLYLLALSVSADSFSVGLSIGMSGVRTVAVLLVFGGSSVILTWIGMFIGRKVHGYIGAYSEMLGGSILCSFGLFIIFS